MLSERISFSSPVQIYNRSISCSVRRFNMAIFSSGTVSLLRSFIGSSLTRETFYFFLGSLYHPSIPHLTPGTLTCYSNCRRPAISISSWKRESIITNCFTNLWRVFRSFSSNWRSLMIFSFSSSPGINGIT